MKKKFDDEDLDLEEERYFSGKYDEEEDTYDDREYGDDFLSYDDDGEEDFRDDDGDAFSDGFILDEDDEDEESEYEDLDDEAFDFE